MLGKITYTFQSVPWKYNGNGGWYFVSLPIDLSNEIRNNLKWQEEGWGRLKATARIGNTEWETAIWFDTKHNSYLLPLKAEIRKLEKIELGTDVKVKLSL